MIKGVCLKGNSWDGNANGNIFFCFGGVEKKFKRMDYEWGKCGDDAHMCLF